MANYLTAALLALCIGMLSACGAAPPQRLAGQSITVRTFRDAETGIGSGVCELDPSDTPETFSLQISAQSADGQSINADETNRLVWPGEQAPVLPITLTLAAPQGANYDIGLVDTLVITQPADTQPGVVVNTFNNGVCRSQREFEAALNKGREQSQASIGSLRAFTVLIASLFGGLGLVYLIKGNWAWAMHVQGQRARGIVNLERTDEWEATRIFGGGALLFFALLIVALGFGLN
jgi:hypothetical protein